MPPAPWRVLAVRINAGSHVGFLLAVLSIHVSLESATAVMMVVPLFALAVPLLDVATAIARRWLRGAPILEADAQHLHHRLVAIGLTHARAALVLYVVAGGFAALGRCLAFAPAPAMHGQRVFPGGIHPKHDDRIGPRLPRPSRASGGPDSVGSSLALALLTGTLPSQTGTPLRTEAGARAAKARGLLAAPRRLGEVVAAYHAFVDASSVDFLSDPPPEFLALQAALTRLATARRPGLGAG